MEEENKKRRNKVHERMRRPIAALVVVWVLLGALGAGAATLADDITGTQGAEQAEGGRVGPIPARGVEQAGGELVGSIPP